MCLAGWGAHHLSALQLSACDLKNFGCSGGYIEYAMQHVAEHGLCLESAWAPAQECSACNAVAGSRITSYEYMHDVSEHALQHMVARGPTVVHFDVTPSFQAHAGLSVYQAPPTGCNQTDHALLVTGWGSDYWVVQNSWGTDWGSHGYAHVARNACNVLTNAFRPIIEAPPVLHDSSEDNTTAALIVAVIAVALMCLCGAALAVQQPRNVPPRHDRAKQSTIERSLIY